MATDIDSTKLRQLAAAGREDPNGFDNGVLLEVYRNLDQIADALEERERLRERYRDAEDRLRVSVSEATRLRDDLRVWRRQAQGAEGIQEDLTQYKGVANDLAWDLKHRDDQWRAAIAKALDLDCDYLGCRPCRALRSLLDQQLGPEGGPEDTDV